MVLVLFFIQAAKLKKKVEIAKLSHQVSFFSLSELSELTESPLPRYHTIAAIR